MRGGRQSRHPGRLGAPSSRASTFDSDLEADELQTVVFEELARIDPEWESHLRVAE